LRILVDYRPALRERTGVGEYVHEMTSALARRLRRGDSLTLFSSSWKDRLSSSPVAGAHVVDVRVPVKVLNFAWHRLGWPPIERLAGPIDVAHSFHPLRMPARHAAEFITIHDLDFLDHPERTRAEIRRDYAALARTHAQRAAVVVTVSRFTAAEVERRLDVPRDRIIVCSPGAPPWRPREAHVPRGPILFMGTLEPRKNVGTLLRAYRRLLERQPDAPPLWLAGGVTEAAAAWMRELLEPPLAGRARHLGYVAADRRYGLYIQASMLVLPSHLEGFGLPVLEAMAAGVPVIASRRGALPEVAGDAALLVEPDDADGLAAAMLRYLEEPATAEAAVQRGVARARHYSWDASAATLYDAYVKAMSAQS
jgi:glycosyltransferase involved in cell wall biosynthesis